jgi:hypothetical protein
MGTNLLQDLAIPVNAQDAATNAYFDSVFYPSPITIAADPAPALVNQIYLVDCTNSALTFTLPDSPAAGSRIRVVDKSGDALNHNITITPSGTNTIQGTTVLDYRFASVSYIYTGGVWHQITEAPGFNASTVSISHSNSNIEWGANTGPLTEDIPVTGNLVAGPTFAVCNGATYNIEVCLQLESSNASIWPLSLNNGTSNIITLDVCRNRSANRGTGLISTSYLYTPSANEILSWSRTSTSQYGDILNNNHTLVITALNPNTGSVIGNTLNLCQAADLTNGVSSGLPGTTVALPTSIAARGNLSLVSNQVQGLLANNTYRITITIAAQNFTDTNNVQIVLMGTSTGTINSNVVIGRGTYGMSTLTIYHIPSANESVYLTYAGGSTTYTHHRVSLEVVMIT